MFNSISDFDRAFMSLFSNVILPIKGVDTSIYYRYYKKSSENYVEEEEQKYPCIIVQDYTPKPREDWFIDLREEMGETSVDGLTMKMYRKPMALTFNYDVSICSKSYNSQSALKNYFTREYLNKTAIILNKVDMGIMGEVGDVIPLRVDIMDIPRTDGVFETNYNFKLDAWVHIQEPRDVDIIKNVILNINPVKSLS